MTELIYLRRDLDCELRPEFTVLGALADEKNRDVKLFLASGSDPDGFQAQGLEDGTGISSFININNGLIGQLVQPDPADRIEVAHKSGGFEIRPARPELHHFKNQRVLLAERNGEPVEILADWIRYHVTQHGVQGFVLIDRSDPARADAEDQTITSLCRDAGAMTVLRICARVPLGQPAPPASHPIFAPEAPGKDKMDLPDNDAWTSPLGEFVLYEMIRHQYLAKADAVANLDLADLLPPDAKLFERLARAPHGLIALQGVRIFPWRVRKNSHPHYGDHICCPFEPTRVVRKWAVRPDRCSDQTLWRYVRITGIEPDDKQVFWRAMALRHPSSTTSEIVPKSSLVENDKLLELSTSVFGRKPVRPPEHKASPINKDPAQPERVCIVTTMKNEGPFILEWIAYHRAIGVTDFLVYTNDCTDGTDSLLSLLETKGIVQHRQNPWKPGGDLKPQHAALQAAEREAVVRSADWLICMDVDEFINVHCGDGTLKALFQQVSEANMISLTWRLFGNAGVSDFEPGFVTDQFTRCAPQLARKPHQAWGFKTLFRNVGIYKKLGVHRPKGLKPDLWDQVAWVNGSGHPMPRSLIRNGWRSTMDSYGYELVTLNHYAVRSAESFLVKRDRGRVNHVDRDQGLSYWFRMNNNWEEDLSIQAKLPKLRREFERLLADPDIAGLHTACVSAHIAKIKELRATQQGGAFFSELTSARLEKLSHMHPYFGANVFLAGPQAIPDDVADLEDIPDDYFFTVRRMPTKH